MTHSQYKECLSLVLEAGKLCILVVGNFLCLKQPSQRVICQELVLFSTPLPKPALLSKLKSSAERQLKLIHFRIVTLRILTTPSHLTRIRKAVISITSLIRIVIIIGFIIGIVVIVMIGVSVVHSSSVVTSVVTSVAGLILSVPEVFWVTGVAWRNACMIRISSIIPRATFIVVALGWRMVKSASVLCQLMTILSKFTPSLHSCRVSNLKII